MRVKLFIFLLSLSLSSEAEWFFYSTTSMTTNVELEFWLENKADAISLSRQVFEEFERIDASMSRHKPNSALSKLNKRAADVPVSVSSELFNVLAKSKEVSWLSGGSFDMTFASVGYLYDFRHSLQPGHKELAQRVAMVDYRHVILDDVAKTVSYKKQGIVVDLGGIAKGYAVDLGIALLKKHGVKSARLSAGGDMRLLGDKQGKPWIVGIKHPRIPDKQKVALPLDNIAISTSGDYERFFIDEKGERIHHILSPKTGRPVNGIQSVSVIGPEAIMTDGLSTALFVLGVEKGIALIDTFEYFDVVMIDADGKVHFSNGLLAAK